MAMQQLDLHRHATALLQRRQSAEEDSDWIRRCGAAVVDKCGGRRCLDVVKKSLEEAFFKKKQLLFGSHVGP